MNSIAECRETYISESELRKIVRESVASLTEGEYDEIINNPDGIGDAPDGKNHYFDDDDALSFIYDRANNRFYLSNQGGVTHRDMMGAEMGLGDSERMAMYDRSSCGRYWKSVNIFSIWDDPDKEIVKEVGENLIRELGNGIRPTLGYGAPYKTYNFEEYVNGDTSGHDDKPVDLDKLNQAKAIHLMHGDDKRQALDGYLDNRTTNTGRKLSYSNGNGEMPMAQWRALHSTSESTESNNGGKLVIGEQALKSMVRGAIKGLLSENTTPEFNEIGMISYTSSFDEDDYNDWLADEGLQPSDENLRQFFKEEVTFEIELFDSDTYHHMFWQNFCYDEIESEYGERIAEEILSDCMEKGQGSLEPMCYISSTVDVNNPQELNAEAMKLLKYGRYFKDARGYILTNGVMIYTEAEHNMVTRIDGINSKSHFISLGNIRVLPNSMDMARKPTPEQERVLVQVVRAYADGPLYVDFMTPNGNESRTYNRPNFEMLMRDINSIYK